jgi:cytochrome b
MIKVWDIVVRVIHWSVALLVLSEFLNESGAAWHRYLGYLAAGLVLARLAWGFATTSYARYAHWFPTPSRFIGYLRATLQGKPPRMLGLNPIGACMALLLWTLVLALGVTGWMMGLDAFWGEEWLEQVHETIAWTLLVCVAVHVTAVIATSIKQRENLPKAMITGKKRPLDRHG